MVGVEMGDEDLLEVGQADDRAHQLTLRALAAVEQQAVAAAADEHGGGAACAVGALPEVPRKTMSRSTRGRLWRSGRRGVAVSLREHEPLAGADVGARKVVRPFDPPDRLANIAGVVPPGDRPQRVVRADSDHLAWPVRLGRAGNGAPDQHGEPHEEQDPDEHVFAMLANACSVVKVRLRGLRLGR